MSTLEIWLLAISVAMDCFSVSITTGIIMRRICWRTFLTMGFFFGLFQALMPLIGWLAASHFSHLIASFDHWIAAGLLFFLGIRMIKESFSDDEERQFNPTRLDFVNERLNLIYSLQQKHRVSSVEELISITEEYRNKLENITSSDNQIQELTAQKEALYNKVKKQAEILSELRKQAAKEIEKQMEAYLIPLGMPNVRFAVELSAKNDKVSPLRYL